MAPNLVYRSLSFVILSYSTTAECRRSIPARRSPGRPARGVNATPAPLRQQHPGTGRGRCHAVTRADTSLAGHEPCEAHVGTTGLYREHSNGLQEFEFRKLN